MTNYLPFFTFEIHERDQVYEFVSEWPQLSPGPLRHQRERERERRDIVVKGPGRAINQQRGTGRHTEDREQVV